ncbi:MAG: response regulator [Syntrophorhabdus sp.]
MIKRILVVDDENNIGLTIQQYLEDAGYETVSFQDPVAALNFCEQNIYSVDLAIVDHGMPGMDGLELAEALRGLKPDLPIVLTTDMPGDDGPFPNTTMTLSKDVPKDKLLSSIQSLLGSKRTH